MDSFQTSTRVSVLVAGNSRIQTQLLSDALQRDPALDVVSWDWQPTSLIPTVVGHRVDVLAISFTFNGHSAQGLDVVRELRSARPETKSVVLLEAQQDDAVISAFRAGAKGIFGRDSSVDLFCKCMHAVHNGDIWIDGRGMALVVEALAAAPRVQAVNADGLNLLSKREQEVVQCLVQGMTNKEIADRIGLSQHTVKNYLFRIFDKLGVSSRVELLFMALSQNNGAGNGQEAVAQASTAAADFSSLQKAAEKGSPSAQLALAQAFLERRGQPDDFVRAYTWYLIASERTSQARALVTRMLTPKQIEEAQQRATEWLARAKQGSSSASVSTRNNVTRMRPGKIAEPTR